MGNAFYLNSKRLQEIIRESAVYTYDMLDACTSIRECMLLLKEIYKQQATEALSNIDYYNLYDMSYILCCEFSQTDDSRYRQHYARMFVGIVKKSPKKIDEIIETYCKTV